MFFKRSVQRYGRTPLPETPYQRAGQVWDERIGSSWPFSGADCKGRGRGPTARDREDETL
jgi:hypothetical protein